MKAVRSSVSVARRARAMMSTDFSPLAGISWMMAIDFMWEIRPRTARLAPGPGALARADHPVGAARDLADRVVVLRGADGRRLVTLTLRPDRREVFRKRERLQQLFRPGVFLLLGQPHRLERRGR